MRNKSAAEFTNPYLLFRSTILQRVHRILEQNIVKNIAAANARSSSYNVLVFWFEFTCYLLNLANTTRLNTNAYPESGRQHAWEWKFKGHPYAGEMDPLKELCVASACPRPPVIGRPRIYLHYKIAHPLSHRRQEHGNFIKGVRLAKQHLIAIVYIYFEDDTSQTHINSFIAFKYY